MVYNITGLMKPSFYCEIHSFFTYFVQPHTPDLHNICITAGKCLQHIQQY